MKHIVWILLIIPFITSAVSFNNGTLCILDEISQFALATQEQIANETQFWHATTEFALKYGGKLTKSILTYLQKNIAAHEFEQLSIDTKVHCLEPHYASFGTGWHCDFTPRKQTFLDVVPWRDTQVKYYFIFSCEPATQYIAQRSITLDSKHTDWPAINSALNQSSIETTSIPVATIICFDGNELHRAIPYTGTQPIKRFFLRAAYFPKGYPLAFDPYLNEMRSFQEIYKIENNNLVSQKTCIAKTE